MLWAITSADTYFFWIVLHARQRRRRQWQQKKKTIQYKKNALDIFHFDSFFFFFFFFSFSFRGCLGKPKTWHSETFRMMTPTNEKIEYNMHVWITNWVWCMENVENITCSSTYSHLVNSFSGSHFKQFRVSNGYMCGSSNINLLGFQHLARWQWVHADTSSSVAWNIQSPYLPWEFRATKPCVVTSFIRSIERPTTD